MRAGGCWSRSRESGEGPEALSQRRGATAEGRGAARPPRAGGAREGRGEAAAAGRALPPLAAPYQPGLMLQGVSGDLLM